MIITCPECATRYSVQDGAIGPAGRTVRCSNCKASWFASRDADMLELMDIEQAEADDIQEAVETASSSRPSIKPTMGAHVQIRDKADQKRRNRRLVGVSMIWGITLGLLGLGAAMAYGFRQNIVDQNPAAATLYAAVGIPVKVAGLDFEKPKTKSILVDGQPALVVNGYVRNLSSDQQALPMVQLSLHGSDGTELVNWLVELDQPALPGGDRIEYIAQYPNPPVDAVSLKYRFLNQAIPDGAETPVGTLLSETP